MTTQHRRRRRLPHAADSSFGAPEDEDAPDDFPVTAQDARRFLALAEQYRRLWARSDDAVERHRLARAVADYRSFAARCKDRRSSNG